MPSVEYDRSALVWSIETMDVEDQETGETVEREVEVAKRPFEIRITKWIKRDDGYHVHGFVSVTDFGQALTYQEDPPAWVSEEFETTDDVSEQVVGEWVDGIAAVQTAELSEILAAGGVESENAAVTEANEWRMEFVVVLSGATTFDIEWLSVCFNPERGG